MKKLVVGEEKCVEIIDGEGGKMLILEIGWFYWMANGHSSGPVIGRVDGGCCVQSEVK